jgi:antitoxin PrlF
MAFLAFIETDLKTHPDRRSRLSKTSLRRAVRLTKDVKVTDDEIIPENVTL